MIRFIEDLGIIPNKGKSVENDPSLKQGQKMMEYGRIYNFFNMNRIRGIESNTYPSKKHSVKTIVETMDTIESKYQDNSKIVLENTISAHEAEFYRVLAEYSNTSKVLAKEMIEQKDADHTLLLKKLTKLYDSLLSISSLIEKELNTLQNVSDNGLAIDFANKKNELETHVKKLKNDREKLGEDYLTIDDDEKIKNIAYVIGLIIIVSISLNQIFYKRNNFYLYVIFLTVVAIIAISNNSHWQ